MPRIKLTIAYDGTAYCGWQVQNNGISIQSTLQAAIEDLVGHKINLTGASRTDSGVHALCQVAVFDTEKDIELRKIPLAINQRLPKDIVIQKAEIVADDFHPRYCDTLKTYEYKILNADYPNPIEHRFTHFVYGELNMEAMKEALSYMEGEHDFAAFASSKCDIEDTVRHITYTNIEKHGDVISIFIQGDGFLHNMVRIIVGTLLKVGKNAWEPSRVKDIIESKDRRNAGPTAPAKGLLLKEIKYL